ncbi:MAG: hypothetical protein VYA30_08135 [Myxococcota bacterium]|nr:hypothetical protein [Myxococcota bacterium]
MKTHWLLLSICVLQGCSLLLKSGSDEECRDERDCVLGESCQSGLCVTAGSDMQTVDDPLDGNVYSDSASLDALDAGIQILGDASDASTPPIQDAAGPQQPFADELCYRGAGGVVPLDENMAQMTPSLTSHIPASDCGSFGFVLTTWSSETGQVELKYVTSKLDPIYKTLDGIQGVPSLNGRYFAVPRLNPNEDSTNIWLQDLSADNGYFINPRSRRQFQVSRASNYTAYLQIDGNFTTLKVQFDDDRLIDCSQPNADQWGLIATDGWLAWFERRRGAQTARLVVSRPDDCGDRNRRRERLLRRPPLDTQSLKTTGADLWWISAVDGEANGVHRWKHTERGQEPEQVELTGAGRGNPVSIEAQTGVLALIHYRLDQSPYTLSLIDLVNGQQTQIRTGRLYNPTLTRHYLLWTEATIGQGWRVNYHALE